MTNQMARDFTVHDELSDVTMIVENTRLYVHRQYLAEWSGVWRRLLLVESGMDPTAAIEIILEDKKLDEITELLQCIYSPQRPITDQNVTFLLQFAEEYDMPSMKMRCEDYFLSNERSLEILILAEKYDMKTLYKRCIEYAKTLTMEDIERSSEYQNLSQETLIRIYKEKINVMRNYANELKQTESKLTHQKNTLEDEKEGMIAMFKNISKLWEMPNKRCYKHMTEERFNYTCRECNEKLQREVRRMCHDGQHVRRFYKINNLTTK